MYSYTKPEIHTVIEKYASHEFRNDIDSLTSKFPQDDNTHFENIMDLCVASSDQHEQVTPEIFSFNIIDDQKLTIYFTCRAILIEDESTTILHYKYYFVRAFSRPHKINGNSVSLNTMGKMLFKAMGKRYGLTKINGLYEKTKALATDILDKI